MAALSMCVAVIHTDVAERSGERCGNATSLAGECQPHKRIWRLLLFVETVSDIVEDLVTTTVGRMLQFTLHVSRDVRSQSLDVKHEVVVLPLKGIIILAEVNRHAFEEAKYANYFFHALMRVSGELSYVHFA